MQRTRKNPKYEEKIKRRQRRRRRRRRRRTSVSTPPSSSSSSLNTCLHTNPLLHFLATVLQFQSPQFLFCCCCCCYYNIKLHIRTAMTGKEILNKMKEKVLGPSDPDSGKGKSKMSHNISHGYHLVKGKSHHAMEDYVVAQFKQIEDHELGLFAIFDGHLSHEIPEYLQSNLFNNILKEPEFWKETEDAVRKAYRITDTNILEKAVDLGKGGSTAVTAILIDCRKLVVANVGDSRAIICKNGVAKQLSVDHEPSTEREQIENRGGFVSNFPGDVPRVDGQLAVARAFGDKSLKKHLSSEPFVMSETIDDETEFAVLASDGLWKVMTNQEVVDAIKNIKDARAAAKHLTEEAVNRKSSDDISCVVVRFR